MGGGCARRGGGAVGEGLPDPPCFGDTLNAGSSTGWTDEKHMLYISSLELSFVTQLCDGEVNSNGMFCWSPSVWRHKTSYNGNHRITKVGQQKYCGMVEGDGAESTGSLPGDTESLLLYGDQEDEKAYYMNDNASTSESRQERNIYHARRNNSGVSSASCFHWHGHSLSRTELSDQNFVGDDATEVREEQSRGYSKKRLKHTADTTSSSAVSSGNANIKQVCHHVEVEYSSSSSDFDIGSPNAELASRESQGSRRWSI